MGSLAVRSFSISAFMASILLTQFGEALSQETYDEVRSSILADIKSKEASLKAETDRLKELYKERDAVDPIKRLDELSETASKLAADSAKAAWDQAKSGPIDTPKEAFDSGKRAKGLLDNYKNMMDAQDKVFQDLDRGQDIGDEITRQEHKVERAASNLGLAKGAAAIVLPIVDAMVESQKTQSHKDASQEVMRSHIDSGRSAEEAAQEAVRQLQDQERAEQERQSADQEKLQAEQLRNHVEAQTNQFDHERPPESVNEQPEQLASPEDSKEIDPPLNEDQLPPADPVEIGPLR